MGKTRKNVSPIPRAQRSAHEHVVVKRRERIATLRNRMLTELEIVEMLGKATINEKPNEFLTLNPKTLRPYSPGTIHNDLAFLRKQAIESSKKEFDEWRAMQLAEIREARKVAWENGLAGLHHVARFLEMEMKLTGTLDASIIFNQQNNFMVDEHGEPIGVREMTDERLLQIASQSSADVIEGELVEGNEDE